ncbi:MULTISPECIES: LacI family DNA-binding transcriptional regulator [unclassified Streptomyces]|uniref:LacI family DNA-binding transcriptional regulator n=1 Tax=unclassified Streptomyces TaxID=2593676 RepID=UPI0004C86BD0|nr:LacI family DNA-binding transcriptional regulator [Streptomyces sp. NRRL F-5727]
MRESEVARPVTAADVARVAGVSQSTVSLVLNGKWQGRVREETALRVRVASDSLGYRVNQAARTLRLGGTGTVLLVVPTLENPVFAAVHAGAARAGAEHGLGVVVFPLGSEDDRGPFPVPKQSIDGVLACSMPAADVAGLSTGLPLVVLDDTPHGPAPTVAMDVGDGMAQALAHLVALGHRRILHARATRPTWTFCRRAEVLEETLLGHPEVEKMDVPVTFSPLEVRDRVTRALTGVFAPTAVVCDDDNIATGVCHAARALGLTVGQDLSVVGFNDLPVASLLAPALTTVRLPVTDLGFRGVEMFMAVAAGENPAPVVLPTELVVRESTAPPRPTA